MINIFPDHPHEGEVVVPADLNDSPGFNGYSHREYPDFGGSAKSPEIIAWARVQDDHTDTSDVTKGAANGKEFGAVGAYNGHCVDVGRVIVDSTWHHWFDVNLTGRSVLLDSTDIRKHDGFNDTAAGQQALAKIKNFYRNVAIWLSPPSKLRCMSLRAFWGSIHRYPLVADLHAKLPLWHIGHHAINVLGHYAGQCNVYLWWQYIAFKVDVGRLFDPDILKGPTELVNDLDKCAVGGMLQAMLEVRDKRGAIGKIPSDKELMALAEKGFKEGLTEFSRLIKDTQTSVAHIERVIKKLKTL